MCEALRDGFRRDSVGFLIDGEGGAKEQGMLLILGLEVLKRFPEVVVNVTWLKCGELEGVSTCIGLRARVASREHEHPRCRCHVVHYK